MIRKTMLRSLCAMLVAVMLLLPALPASADGGDTYWAYIKVTDQGNINLRAAPSAAAEWLGSFPGGTRVDVLSVSGNWARIIVNGITGYMSVNFLEGNLPPDTSAYSKPSGASSSGSFSSATGVVPSVDFSKSITMYVNTGNSGKLHLREYASQNSRSLGLYPNGTQVSAVNLNNGWCCVNVYGRVGYMMSRYLTSSYNPQPQPQPGGYTLMYVSTGNTGRLHLRAAMSVDAASLGLYANGTQVYMIADYGTWAYVYVNGQYGYMMRRYLAPSGTPQPQPPQPQPAPIGTAVVRHPNNSFVYLRSSRSTANLSNVLAKVPSGSTVDVYEQDKWYSLIRYDGITGYMVSHYLYVSGSIVPSVPSVPVSGQPVYGTVIHPNGSFVYLRYSKSRVDLTNVLAQVPSGSAVEVYEQDINWSKVRYNGMSGYMMTQFVYGAGTLNPAVPTYPSAAPSFPASIYPYVNGTAVVRNENSSFVYMRSSRSSSVSSNIIMGVSNGAVVEVLETDQYWSKIRYQNVEGYMVTNYLKPI